MKNEEREKNIILDIFCNKHSTALTYSKLFENNDFCILGVNLQLKFLINFEIDGDIDLLYIPLKYPKNYNECLALNENIEIIPNYNILIANEIKTQYINKEDKLKSLKYNTESKIESFLKQTEKLYSIGFLNTNLIFINSNEPIFEINGINSWFSESKRVENILDDMYKNKLLNRLNEDNYNFSISVFEVGQLKDRLIRYSSTFSETKIYERKNIINNNLKKELKIILEEKINTILPNEINCWNLPLIIRMCKGSEKHLYINNQSEITNCPICNSIPY